MFYKHNLRKTRNHVKHTSKSRRSPVCNCIVTALRPSVLSLTLWVCAHLNLGFFTADPLLLNQFAWRLSKSECLLGHERTIMPLFYKQPDKLAWHGLVRKKGLVVKEHYSIVSKQCCGLWWFSVIFSL